MDDTNSTKGPAQDAEDTDGFALRRERPAQLDPRPERPRFGDLLGAPVILPRESEEPARALRAES